LERTPLVAGQSKYGKISNVFVRCVAIVVQVEMKKEERELDVRYLSSNLVIDESSWTKNTVGKRT